MKPAQLGLEAVMIVNRGPPHTDAFFLGGDGTVDQIQKLGEEAQPAGIGEFFVGEDGTLYEMRGSDLDGAVEGVSDGTVDEKQARELGHYLLGADGRLYEAIT